MIAQHPDTGDLRSKLEKCLPCAGAWVGAAYRFVTIPYSNRRDLLSGVGSREHGGRWNPPGLFNVLYGSLTPNTAVAEALGTLNGFGIPPSQARPRVFVAISFRLQTVLDLTDAAVARILDMRFARLLKEDWKAAQDAGYEAATQAIGRIAWELKVEAIIVPSAVASGEKNVAVFPGRRQRGSSWKIQGARDLPKKP